MSRLRPPSRRQLGWSSAPRPTISVILTSYTQELTAFVVVGTVDVVEVVPAALDAPEEAGGAAATDATRAKRARNLEVETNIMVMSGVDGGCRSEKGGFGMKES